MTLIRYVKKQVDRWCETMDQEPAVFHITELDYRYIGMDVEMAGRTESMRNAQAAVDLCSRTLAQLRNADLGLLEAYRRFESMFEQNSGHLVLQNVQSIHEAILAVRSEISILHARTERTASISNELIRRFASALEMG